MLLQEKQRSCANRRVLRAASYSPSFRDDSTLSRSAFPVAAGVRPTDREFLVLDSGSGVHSVQHHAQLADFSTLDPAKVTVFGGSQIELQGHGRLTCVVASDRGTSSLELPRVEVLPSGPPMASISSLTNFGYIVTFFRTHAVMIHPDGTKSRCHRVGEHYHLDIATTDQGANVTDVAVA
jgi:hypothetical protein